MIPVLVSMTRTTADLPSVKRLLLYDLSSPTTVVFRNEAPVPVMDVVIPLA